MPFLRAAGVKVRFHGFYSLPLTLRLSRWRQQNVTTCHLKGNIYEVIKTAEREPKLGVRKLALRFGCGKTQISTILKNKEAVRELYESNASDSLCQVRKRNRKSEYADLNDTLYQWYQLCVKKNIYPDGSLLAEKAVMIAEILGHENFKASNGWLHRWKV